MRRFCLPLLLCAPLLAACATLTPEQVRVAQVACQVNGVLHPVVVSLLPLAGDTGVTAASVDAALVHPLVVAACAQVNGTPLQAEAAS